MDRTMILTLFLCLIVKFSDSAVINTLVPQKSPYFESGAVTLVYTYSTPIQYTCSITYKTAKSTSSPMRLLSYHTVDYDLNRIFTYNSTLLLNINLYISTSTNTGFIALAEVLTTYHLKLLKYSYFVIDPLFPYFSSFDFKFVSFSNRNSYYTINHSALNPIFAVFLWGLNCEVYPSSSVSVQLFGFHWQQVVVDSQNTRFYLRSTMTNYMNLQTKVIFMTIYTTSIPVIQYKLETFPLSTSGSLSANYSSLIFSQGKSDYMIGLTNFYLQAHQNQVSPSFRFNIDILQEGLFKLSNQNVFSAANINAFIITRLQCPSTHPFKKKNTTTLVYDCHDSCTLTQFEYYDDFNEVYLCKSCLFPCSSCSSTTICKTCVSYMDLDSSFGCVLKNTYANMSSTIKLCSLVMSGCVTCLSDGSECTSCQSSYVLSPSRTSCLLCSGIYNLCKSCTDSYCLVCNQGYILQTPTLCAQDASNIPFVVIECDSNCSKCDTSDPSFCLSCIDKQHVLLNGVCTNKCGDGKIMGPQECDDNNLQNLDGCSSECKIEQDFQCLSKPYNSITSNYNISQCRYSKTITFSVRRMIKEPYENKFSIYLQTQIVYVSAWKDVNLSEIIKFSGTASNSVKLIKASFDHVLLPRLSSVRLLQQSYDPNNYRYLYIQLSYNQTLENKDLTIIINPNNSHLFTFSSSGSFQSQINMFSHNNMLAHYYQQSYYQSAQSLYKVSQVIGIAIFGMIFLGIFLGNMMVSFQASFMCQLSYFSLLNIGEVNPLFYALSGMRFSSGYNIPLMSETPIYEENNNKQVVGIQMYQSFANNVNISLVLVVLSLLVGGILKLINRYLIKNQQTKQKLATIGSNLLGSVSFYLMHCFTFLIVISIAINFITNTSNPLNFMLIGVSCLVIIILTGLFFKFHQTQYFSRVVQKIKHNKRIYLISGLVLKVVIGILIVFMSKSIFGCISVCALYSLWSLIVIVKLKPYRQAHSLRLTSSLILCLFIQIIFVYQRLSTESNPQEDINLYLPFSVIILLTLILTINLTFYVYSIKQIRCCQLEIQWQKVKNEDSVKKVKDQKIKEIQVDDNLIQNQSKVKKNSNLLKDNDIQQPIYGSNKTKKKQSKIYDTQNDQLSLLSNKDQNQRKLQQNNFGNQVSENNKLPELVNRQKIQQQIKKQLKSSQINPTFSSIRKKKKSNSDLFFDQTDSIYSKLKENYFIAQEKEQEQQQVPKKYVYTNQDLYCTYEQFSKI